MMCSYMLLMMCWIDTPLTPILEKFQGEPMYIITREAFVCGTADSRLL